MKRLAPTRFVLSFPFVLRAMQVITKCSYMLHITTTGCDSITINDTANEYLAVRIYLSIFIGRSTYVYIFHTRYLSALFAFAYPPLVAAYRVRTAIRRGRPAIIFEGRAIKRSKRNSDNGLGVRYRFVGSSKFGLGCGYNKNELRRERATFREKRAVL